MGCLYLREKISTAIFTGNGGDGGWRFDSQ